MTIRSVRGMRDILPGDTPLWHRLEAIAREVLRCYGYNEIRLPLVEKTELFARGIGEETDIVSKEMYTFADRKGQMITLRPEGTASVIRAAIQNGLCQERSVTKLSYYGPMFRYERPQKGRSRQFTQLGIEALGSVDPRLDAETIIVLMDLLAKWGVPDTRLAINSLGCRECRPPYLEMLRGHFSGHTGELCSDCRERLEKNPMRLLDCKRNECRDVREAAPVMIDSICSDCLSHFDAVQGFLRSAGLAWDVDPCLVRGLDYYTRTTYEVFSGLLGAQDAVAGGGRYDGLVKDLGGPDVPAVGFALGMERIVLALSEGDSRVAEGPAVVVVTLGEEALAPGFNLLIELRRLGVSAEGDFMGASLRSQMRRAEKAKARFVIIIGTDEIRSGRCAMRDMAHRRQEEIPLEGVAAVAAARINAAGPQPNPNSLTQTLSQRERD